MAHHASSQEYVRPTLSAGCIVQRCVLFLPAPKPAVTGPLAERPASSRGPVLQRLCAKGRRHLAGGGVGRAAACLLSHPGLP